MASILPRPSTGTPTTDAPDGSLPVQQLELLLNANLVGPTLDMALQLLAAISESVRGTTSSVVENPDPSSDPSPGMDRNLTYGQVMDRQRRWNLDSAAAQDTRKRFPLISTRQV